MQDLVKLATAAFHSSICLSGKIPTRAAGILNGDSLQARVEGDFDMEDTAKENSYWVQERNGYKTSEGVNERNFGMRDDLDTETTDLEWESFKTSFGDVHVLLPPPTVLQPIAILHFVGGTFFGSAPTIWYKELLEDLVKQSPIAIIASTIPVTLLQSPLQHVDLARRIEKQFQFAWREVLVDEYGEEIERVPTCAVGHSLGARLLVVGSTLDPLKSRSRKSHQPPPYRSCVLISFTNYGASAGIPGIYQLNRISKRMEQEKKQHSRRHGQSRRTGFSSDRGGRGYDDEDFDEWDDERFVSDLQEGLREQASRVKEALTPRSRDLEFYPTPDQLWAAIGEEQRYTVPQSLIVQFDDDRVDQSAKLATVLRNSTDLKYCRLRGNHLTPISIADSSEWNRSWFARLNSSLGSVFWKLLSGKKRSRTNQQSLLALRQSLSRYITEVVTK